MIASELKMKVDVHTHILPKDWPNLDEVSLCHANPRTSLKEPQVIKTREFPKIGYASLTEKTQVKINFEQ